MTGKHRQTSVKTAIDDERAERMLVAVERIAEYVPGIFVGLICVMGFLAALIIAVAVQ